MDEISRIHFEDWEPTETPVPRRTESAHRRAARKDTFWKKYAILIVGAAAFTIYTILLASWVNYRAEREAKETTRIAVRSAVATAENHIFDVLGITREQFQEMEKAKEEGETTILTGQASWEAYVQREIGSVSAVISKLSTDAQKCTEASCMLARVMSPDYPNTFEAVAKQPKQWMFYDGKDNTYSQADWDIAESIVRPYLENGIYPNGLTADMVHGSWSQNDYVLRDNYEGSGTMHTWRYSN